MNLKNSFLPPEEHEKQKLAFFAQFIVLGEFDDGWKALLYNELQDYIQSLSNENTTINTSIEETKEYIDMTLGVNTPLAETSHEWLIQQLTHIQSYFHAYPVSHYRGFGMESFPDFPIVVRTKEDFGYPRYALQEQYRTYLNSQKQLTQISHIISKFSDGDDVLMQQKKMLEDQKVALQEMTELQYTRMKELESRLLLEIAQTPTQQIGQNIGPLTAASIGKGYGTSPSFVDYLEKISQEIRNLRAHVNNFQAQLQSITSVNTLFSSQGILTDVKEGKAGFLESACLHGNMSQKVFVTDRVHNFLLPEVPLFQKIKVLRKGSSNTLLMFQGFFIDQPPRIFYLENEEYHTLDIEGDTEFDDIIEQKYDKNGILVFGIVKKGNKIKMFYRDDNHKYEYIHIEGDSEFNNINKKIIDENNILIWGKVQKGNKYKMFYRNGNRQYIYLRIEGDTEFDKIYYDMEYDDKRIPIGGKVKQGNKEKRFYRNENDEYVYLSIEGDTEFDSIFGVKFDKGIPISGQVKQGNKEKIFYRNENDEYVYLSIEGDTEFDSIHYDIEYDDKYIPVSGQVKQGNKEKIFYRNENDEYVYLSIEGDTEFDSIFRVNFDKCIPISGKIKQGKKQKVFYRNENDEYVYLSIEGDTEFDSIHYDIEYDDKYITVSGRVKQGKKQKVFYTNSHDEYVYFKSILRYLLFR